MNAPSILGRTHAAGSAFRGSHRRVRAGTARLLASLLLLSPMLARAQPPAVETANPAACSPNASRGRESCEPATTEQVLTFSLELPPVKIAQCAATIEFEYAKRGAFARIEGTLDHKDCAASRGEYTITVRVRDDDFVVTTHELSATWERADDQPVHFDANYEIGENVDLMGVLVRQSRCTCAGAPLEE